MPARPATCKRACASSTSGRTTISCRATAKNSRRRSKLAAGEWRALPSSEWLRVMRLKSITPPKPADFESLRGVVLQDWTDATLAEQRSAAVRALAKKYTVRIEGRNNDAHAALLLFALLALGG